MARKKGPATAEEFRVAAARQRVLADVGRLRILSLLRLGPLNVTDLTRRLNETGIGLTQPTVSHHLTALLGARFVGYVKNGRTVTYALNPDELASVAGVEAMTLIERGV